MSDIDKCREEFEKIEWVKERLKYVWWSQNNEYCDTGKHPRANASFLNGALHLFREQQEKVEKLQKRINAVLNVLKILEILEDEKWQEWEGSSEMYAQGESSAYGHVGRMLEQSLTDE